VPEPATTPNTIAGRARRTLDGMDDELAISVRGLRKAYGDNVAVAGVDLAVHRGEVFALLGPNGAGKTTTVEILEGYRQRDGGEVSVLGSDPAHPDPRWRSRVGIVLQGTGEFDELTVGEVVRHFSGFYPDADDPAKVVERVGLGAKAKARTHTLSGGQKRRLDVALGIIGRPELLFLDEPTTGFDPEARREFWELIRDLAAGGSRSPRRTCSATARRPWRRSPGVPPRGCGRARRARRRRPWSRSWPRATAARCPVSR
jgi:ABC-2 type transport system ATP-binding protein